MNTVIQVENLGKRYRLGAINHGMLFKDVQAAWAKFRGKPNPFMRIGEEHRTDIDEFWALKDINFKVMAGEVVGIIGKNGSGKSTLLKILSQITLPTEGLVKLRGRVASLLEVGTGFHPELSGRDNIFLNGAILGMSKYEIRLKLDEIIDFSGVREFIDTPVKRYSSGMYVRLAFSVAAHLEPEILIVDEALSVGDAEFQEKCLSKMQQFGKSGRTILFVSHSTELIAKLCSRVMILDKHTLAFDGSTENALQNYALLTHKTGLSATNP